MRPIYARTLTPAERRELHRMLDDPKVGYRAKIILMSAEGYSLSEIEAEGSACHYRNAYKWLTRFNREGLAALRPLKRQPRRRITPEAEARIVELARSSPRDLGLRFSNWSLRLLVGYLMQGGVEISHTYLRQILKRHSIGWRTSRRKMRSRDPRYSLKAARVERLYERKPRNGVVLVIDEKGPVKAKTYGGRKWCGEAAVLDFPQKTNGGVCLFGAHNPHADKMHIFDYPLKRSAQFVEFVGELKKVYRRWPLHLILDGATIHKSQTTREGLRRWKNIHLVPLPTRAPELSTVENRWGALQREAIDNQTFPDVEAIQTTIYDWVEAYNDGTRKRFLAH